MKAPLRFCVLGASLVLVSGCFLVPTEVPAELLAVKDDPNAFSKAGHPLTDVAVGTVIDDLDQLDGCWVTYERASFEHYISGDTIEYDFYALLKFDRERHRFTQYVLSSFSEFDVPPGSLLFIISSGPYSIVADNTIRRETERIRGGRLLEDGRIIFDYDAAAFWSLGEGAVWASFVTIDGDFMKTLDFPEMIDEWTDEQIQDYSNDWFRVACTSQ